MTEKVLLVFELGKGQGKELFDLADHTARAMVKAEPRMGTLDDVRSFILTNAMVHLEGDVDAVKDLLRSAWHRYTGIAGGLS